MSGTQSCLTDGTYDHCACGSPNDVHGTDAVADVAPPPPDTMEAATPTDVAAPDVQPDADACAGTVCGGACVDTRTDARHCGNCSTDCTMLAHVAGSIACVAGGCMVAGHCASGYADCDGNAANGCEADLSSSSNCGACGVACATGIACTHGMCQCPIGQILCGGVCVSNSTDMNCGRCGNVCDPGTCGMCQPMGSSFWCGPPC
jgi:hypothetical protein